MNAERIKKFSGSIFISGFMASGKSTIGRQMAQELELPFYDLDDVIVEKEGRSINRIFEDDGEAYFREKEWQYLLELTQTTKGVISLGGGALQNQRVVDHLKIYGILVFIDTPFSEIVERVARNDKRPILWDENGKIKSKQTLYDELKTLYLSREKYYNQAQVSVNTSSLSAAEAAQKAIQKISRHV
ncbi:MAG: shikimate kinase [Balneola sp.]|nr:shikimate kinase [Balneola sp.]|tara:strand:- start:260823 stop:261383 length:561 start_codon:yes stop_codon:yes gene_type:complete